MHACGKQFLGGYRLDSGVLWKEYREVKQTYMQLAKKYKCSVRTIRRKLDLFNFRIFRQTALRHSEEYYLLSLFDLFFQSLPSFFQCFTGQQ